MLESVSRHCRRGSRPGAARRRARWRLVAAALAISAAPASSALAQRAAYEELQTFSGVLNYVRLNYVDSVSYSRLVRAAIDGVLRSLDPHSRFVPRREWGKFLALGKGELGVTGIAVEDVDGVATVLTVTRKSPAAKAGVMPGDRIVMLDEAPTAGLGARTVEMLLAGDEGSKVRLTLERGPRLEPDTFRVTLKRAEYESRSVAAAVMADSVTGYVRLEAFGAEAGDEVRDALKRLRRRGAKRAILDLRGNPGGRLSAAVDVASEFLPEKTLAFRTEGRKSDVDKRYLTERKGHFVTEPLIVLVDEGSASAAEVLAGSLQDHDRALVLGRRTFGKALVQSVFPLPSGDVVWLTIGRVITPSGRFIQRRYRGLAVERYRAMAGRVGSADDTLPVFRTDSGREVRGGGGIAPDVALPAPAALPVWWSVAAGNGLDAAVADSAAHSPWARRLSRGDWIDAPQEWRARLLDPFLERVRSELGIRAAPGRAVEDRIAERLAARLAEVRWGVEAREEFEIRNDSDVRAALASFQR